MLLELWQVYIAPVDKEDLLKQLQSLLTEPAREDFPLVAPALAKARSRTSPFIPMNCSEEGDKQLAQLAPACQTF